MLEVFWSRCGAEDCVRLAGLEPSADVQIRPATAVAFGATPPMAGRVVREGDELCFVPRFAFADGTTYTVAVDGAVLATLVRPRPEGSATTKVVAIYPTAGEVPRNLLRLYVWFSAPMSEGYAARHVRLVDAGGAEMPGVSLSTEYELWDAAHRRLTVLLDPARIKRGLVAHRLIGYPLSVGATFRVVVDSAFRDASGVPLSAPGQRDYHVGSDQRHRVDPRRWDLGVPRCGTVQPLDVVFEQPLDHGLLGRCLQVIGPGGGPIVGNSEIGPGERSWRLTPRQAWAPGLHRLVIDPVLEDIAGNSVSRVFDRDLTGPEEEPARAGSVTVPFSPLRDG